MKYVQFGKILFNLFYFLQEKQSKHYSIYETEELWNGLCKTRGVLCSKVHKPVNLSDLHGRRSPAIQNEKVGDLARRLF